MEINYFSYQIPWAVFMEVYLLLHLGTFGFFHILFVIIICLGSSAVIVQKNVFPCLRHSYRSRADFLYGRQKQADQNSYNSSANPGERAGKSAGWTT
jgi:uncharacterized membrane protein